MSERAIAELGERYAHHEGAADFWSMTNVGVGAGSLSCFPTEPPSDRPLWPLDLGHIDIHPVTKDGWWGDCTRTFVLGDVPEYAELDELMRELHRTLLATARPGMPANELHGVFASECQRNGLLPLDRLHNIGHSLARSEAYTDGYINAHNTTPMWGAWAVEPFAGNHLYGIKIEDVVWFGPDGCLVVR